uniref:Sperm surface protein Sp17 n=1 Tax=Poecilia latipinna TaxID=48699 RepID=A0A3B3UFW6_9TELE
MSVPFSNTHLRVPRGFGALLEGLTREVLRDQPDNIPAYAAQYFDKLLKEREESGADPSEWAAKLEDRFYNNHEITETQEKEITETRGEREITETQKETEITETQENERTETQKETEITETQENERTETQKETERTETQKEKEVTETPSGGEITETQKEKEITETQKEKEITETEVSLEKTGGSPSVSEKSFDSVKEGKQVTFKDEDEIFTPEFDFEFEETDYEESPSDSSDGTPADSKEEKGPAER